MPRQAKAGNFQGADVGRQVEENRRVLRVRLLGAPQLFLDEERLRFGAPTGALSLLV